MIVPTFVNGLELAAGHGTFGMMSLVKSENQLAGCAATITGIMLFAAVCGFREST